MLILNLPFAAVCNALILAIMRVNSDPPFSLSLPAPQAIAATSLALMLNSVLPTTIFKNFLIASTNFFKILPTSVASVGSAPIAIAACTKKAIDSLCKVSSGTLPVFLSR